jgi:hypothetical protein
VSSSPCSGVAAEKASLRRPDEQALTGFAPGVSLQHARDDRAWRRLPGDEERSSDRHGRVWTWEPIVPRGPCLEWAGFSLTSALESKALVPPSRESPGVALSSFKGSRNRFPVVGQTEARRACCRWTAAGEAQRLANCTNGCMRACSTTYWACCDAVRVGMNVSARFEGLTLRRGSVAS